MIKKIAIIPARGGSKRIPQKNIKLFLGKPIISYSIKAAIKSKLFDEIMVSTDDNEIKEISEKLGAKVPFMRTKKNSNDYATTPEVISEVLKNYLKSGKSFDYVCCIYPAAPLIRWKKILEGYELIKTENFNSVLTLAQYSTPIQRALKINNQKVEMILPENEYSRSQDLEKTFYDAGQFYWISQDFFLKNDKIFNENTGGILLSQLETQDIDNLEDFELAALKFKINKYD